VKQVFRHRRQGQRGFTLVELVFTLLIAALLLSIGVPSFQSQIRNNRLSAAANDLVAAFAFAKSETIGRSDFVSLCQFDTSTQNCATSGGWEQGWMVFVDSDANGAIDDPNDPTGLLYVHQPLANGITARGTAGASGPFITFRPNGLTSMTTTQTIMLCDERGYSSEARGVVISILGKASNMLAADSGQTTCLIP
jgi:type IV fimbrial biogenesis protein FimT